MGWEANLPEDPGYDSGVRVAGLGRVAEYGNASEAFCCESFNLARCRESWKDGSTAVKLLCNSCHWIVDV